MIADSVGAPHLVRFLEAHIQRAFVEYLLNIGQAVEQMEKRKQEM